MIQLINNFGIKIGTQFLLPFNFETSTFEYIYGEVLRKLEILKEKQCIEFEDFKIFSIKYEPSMTLSRTGRKVRGTHVDFSRFIIKQTLEYEDVKDNLVRYLINEEETYKLNDSEYKFTYLAVVVQSAQQMTPVVFQNCNKTSPGVNITMNNE